MKTVDHISEILRYPLTALAFCGCFHVFLRSNEETWQKIQTCKPKKLFLNILSFLTALVHVINFIRAFWFLAYVVPDFDSMNSYYIQIYAYLIYGTFVYVSESIIFSIHYSSVVKGLSLYGERYGFCKSLSFLKTLTMVGTIGCGISLVLTQVVLITNISSEEELELIFPLTSYSVPLACITGVYLILMVFPIAYFILLYTAVIGVVILEFRDTACQMLNILKDPTWHETILRDFENIKKRHQTLSQVVTHLSKLTRLSCSVGIVFCVAITFFALYALSSGRLPKAFVVQEALVFAWILAPLVIICIIWSMLPASAWAVLDSISSVSTAGWSRELLLQVQLFVSSCSFRRIGIDVYGLFVLDNQSFLMVMGTIATYGVVVIQFQHDQDKTTICHFNSTTQ